MKSFAFLIILVLFFALNHTSHDSEPSFTEKNREDLPIPSDWPKWQHALDENRLDSIKIHLINKKPTFTYQSKIGGIPYWPKDHPYPVDKKGNPLFFLAQINFSEIIESPEGYPKTGLLQFFISNDDLYGLEPLDKKNTLEDYLNSKKNFAVIYHKNINETSTSLDRAILSSINDDLLPIWGESAIGFSLSSDVATPADYRFAKITSFLGVPTNEIRNYAYDTLWSSPAHKIGGYASFTQNDPRQFYAPDDNWLLLFQLDTDSNEHINIMWGDSGIGNFFIQPKDLENLNFENVWYNWDCF